MINLANVIHSPMLSQNITIKRTSGVWENGEFVVDDSEQLTARGIVTVASPRDLQVVPEGDRQSGAIKILTTIRLRVTGEGDDRANFADIVLWHGEEYKVYSVTPDSDYGFYRAIAVRVLEEGPANDES